MYLGFSLFSGMVLIKCFRNEVTNYTCHFFRDLPDNPSVQWDTQLLASFVLKHIEANNINLVM